MRFQSVRVDAFVRCCCTHNVYISSYRIYIVNTQKRTDDMKVPQRAFTVTFSESAVISITYRKKLGFCYDFPVKGRPWIAAGAFGLVAIESARRALVKVSKSATIPLVQ
jgi:hypothetical protein